MKVELGLPRLANQLALLIEYEYDLPLIPPMVRDYLCTLAEHVFTHFDSERAFLLGLAGFGIADDDR